MKAPSRRALVLGAVAFGALYLAFSYVVHTHALDAADLKVNAWAAHNAGEGFLGVSWSTWTVLGSAGISVTVVGLMAFLCVRSGAWRTAVVIVAVSLAGGLAVDGFKALHGRPYPQHGYYVLDGNGTDPCPREEWCQYREGNVTVLCPPGSHCRFLVGTENGTERANQTFVMADLDTFPSEDGNAYPSGHTMGATLSWGAALLLGTRALQRRRDFDKAAVAVWAVVAVMGGVSRVPVFSHWWTDVVGSWLLALCLLAVAILADNRWGTRAGAEALADPRGPEQGPGLPPGP